MASLTSVRRFGMRTTEPWLAVSTLNRASKQPAALQVTPLLFCGVMWRSVYQALVLISSGSVAPRALEVLAIAVDAVR